MEIPYVDFRSDVDTRPPVINMMPHPNVMASVFVDIIRAWNWKGFTILYETASWLPRVSEILKLYDSKGYTITVRRLNIGKPDNDYRSVLHRVRKSADQHILLECSIESLKEILTQAQQVGLMTDKHEFIITNIDMHTIDLTTFKHSGTNITGVCLINQENDLMKNVSTLIKEFASENGEKVDIGLVPAKMRTQTALIYDAVLLLVAALDQLDADMLEPPSNLSCRKRQSWDHGNSVTNFMRSVRP